METQSKPPQDPAAMDVAIVHIEKMTPTEWKRCIKNNLYFRCRKPRHSSQQCNTFSSTPKVAKVEEMEEATEEELMIAKVSVSDFF